MQDLEHPLPITPPALQPRSVFEGAEPTSEDRMQLDHPPAQPVSPLSHRFHRGNVHSPALTTPPGRAGASNQRSYRDVVRSPPADAAATDLSPPPLPLPRRRPPVGSPTSRRIPQPSGTQLLQDATLSLVSLAPVGTPVQRDAIAALARQNEQQDAMQSHEEQFGIYSFPNLLALRESVVANWCYWCIAREEHSAFVGHKAYGCNKIGIHRHYSLSSLPIGEFTFIKARTWTRKERVFDSDRNICFFCHWPYDELHLHPSGTRDSANCVGADIFLPLSWILLADQSSKEQMQTALQIPPEVIHNPIAFFGWLALPFRNVTWAGVETKLYNIQRVVLWAVLVRRRYRPPGIT
jgi:hypothetical protein